MKHGMATRCVTWLAALALAVWSAQNVGAQTTPASATAKLPALYVVGDSTAARNNSPTIQGWGVPFLTYFDPAKIHVENAALGGRSSRTYITEGQLDKLTAKLNPGDIVLLQWGHNDPYPLNDANGRGSLFGIGDETQEITRSTTNKPETLHTFGWYMRQQIAAIQAKGALPLVLTLTIRDKWINGKIEREPAQTPIADGASTTADNRAKEPTRYSVWSAEIAKAAHLPLLDVHNMIADRYEAEGKAVVDTYFQSAGDPTHRNAKGAEVDAEVTLAVLKAYKGPAFDQYLNDKGKAVAAADGKYVLANAAAKLDLQPFAYAKGSLDKEGDLPKSPRTGKVMLVLAGDSTVTYDAGYASGLRAHLDKALQIVDLSRGGRTTATFRSDGRWQQMLDLKPDYVLIQFGHNDSAYITLEQYTQNLIKFVDEARAAGVQPILATPISRRYFQADGKIHSDLIAHAEAVKKIAADKKVLLVDFHQRAIELYERLGPDATAKWGLVKANPDLAKATNPSTMPATVYDKTHFNEAANRVIGNTVAAELKRGVPDLAPYIDSDYVIP